MNTTLKITAIGLLIFSAVAFGFVLIIGFSDKTPSPSKAKELDVKHKDESAIGSRVESFSVLSKNEKSSIDALRKRIEVLESEVEFLKAHDSQQQEFVETELQKQNLVRKREHRYQEWLSKVDLGSVFFNPGPIEATEEQVSQYTPLQVGQSVQVQYKDKTWWAAEITNLEKDGRVGICYIGWNDSWNETVARDHLRLDKDAVSKALQTPSARNNLRRIFEEAEQGTAASP
jgi:TolA-binding protein